MRWRSSSGRANATRRLGATRCIFAISSDGQRRQPALGVSEADHASRLPERDNVRSALDWCFSTDGDSALGAELSAGAELWFFVDLGITELDPSGGERQSSDHFTRDFDAAVSRNDVDGQARALVGLWNHHAFQGEHDKALAAAERLSAVASRIGDPAARLSADQVMGHVLVMLGRGREARGYLERFLNAEHATVGREERYRFPLDERGPTRAMLSRALWLLGLIDQARREAEAALDELSAEENPLVVCRVLQLGCAASCTPPAISWPPSMPSRALRNGHGHELALLADRGTFHIGKVDD